VTRTRVDPDLAKQVLALRRAGASFDAIAERLHITARTARASFEQAMGSLKPDLSAALEADRLDRLHMAAWPAAVNGDLNAIDRVLKIGERRDKVVAPTAKNDHALRKAFDQTASTCTALVEGADVALVAAGRRIADQIDTAVAAGDGKALYLVPHMMTVLREMLATPAARAAAQAKVPVAAQAKDEGRLARLRAVHTATSARDARSG
jgi:hypothetical protein